MKNSNMLSYKGYLGQIEFDPEAKVFYGRVLNTQDTITFQSEHAAKLEEEFQTSIDTYLEFCQELGEEPEKPYSGRFVLRLPPEGHRAVALAAQLANQSLNTWIAEHLIESANEELHHSQ
jgi:predicted HicB family RNase H-like nuclease